MSEKATKSKPTNENKASQQDIELHEDEWMIRPCTLYKHEYHDCKTIQARWHQYYVFGELLDCSQWKTDYNNCYLWEKYRSREAYDKLIKSEKEHRINRLVGHYRNDVWQRRDKPPENWNAPLPDWLEEQSKNSYLRCLNEKLKEDLKNEHTSS